VLVKTFQDRLGVLTLNESTPYVLDRAYVAAEQPL
jgi:hypothetical protein